MRISPTTSGSPQSLRSIRDKPFQRNPMQRLRFTESCYSNRVDLSRSAIQNLLDLPDLLGGTCSRFRIDSAPNVIEPAMHIHQRLTEEALREIGDLLEDVVDQRLVLGEMLSPFVGNLVDPFAVGFRHRARVPEILEHG